MAALERAIAAMPEAGLRVFAISRFFRTPCFPAGAGPDYVNAVVKVGFGLSPRQVLDRLHRIEAKFGRTRKERWGMRTLDLDLLAVGDLVLPDPQTHERWRNLPLADQARIAPDCLVLPHPRLQDRAFVLVPMRDVGSEWTHPVLGLSVAHMYDALAEDEIDAVQPL